MAIRSLLAAALATATVATGCDPARTTDVPCDLVTEHVHELTAALAPTALEQDARADYVAALVQATGPTDCAALTPESRACQMRAQTLHAALACLPAPAGSPITIEQRGDDTIVGPTAAPPLPRPTLPKSE